MNRRAAILCCVALFACSCRTGPRTAIFNAELAKALESYESTMAAKRTELRFESGQVVSNCSEYLKLRGAQPIAEEVNNKIVSQEYLICDSLRLVRAAHNNATAGCAPQAYGEELRNRLDLRSFPSSLRPAADDRNFVLSALNAIPSKADRYAVVSDTEDWFYKIETVASLDLDADGTCDWLLWLIDEARTGNYRGYEVLTVYSPAATGSLIANEIR